MSLVYGKERILLEIGRAFEPAKDVIDPVMNLRKENCLYDQLRIGSVPLVEGIYSKNYIRDFDLLASEDCDLHTSIFVSHLHLDHMCCMGLVDDAVDVYVTEPLLRIEQALETVGKGVDTLRTNGYKIMDPTWEYTIGEITVKPFLLNSRSYQDLSFYVKTPDMKLHYTGDVFLHGDYADAVWDEMNYLKKEKIDVLVCETTTLMDSTMEMFYGDKDAEIVGYPEVPEWMLDTEQVNKKLLDLLKEMTGLCVFNHYEREMTDVELFQKMAKETNRIICYEPETAYIVWKFFNKPIHVYVTDNRYTQPWFKELLENNPVVTKQEIHQNPKGYLIQNTYEHIMELFDLPDGCYLHSGGIPTGTYDPRYANLCKIVEMSGFKHVNFFMKNYFGHAYPPQLKYYCDQIDAKVLVPVHGYNPERLYAANGRQRLLPKQYQTYVLENNQLVEEES